MRDLLALLDPRVWWQLARIFFGGADLVEIHRQRANQERQER